jgi:hypothetical protein
MPSIKQYNAGYGPKRIGAMLTTPAERASYNKEWDDYREKYRIWKEKNQPDMSASSCSLCGASGVNKSTCPLNPECANPKPLKHKAATAALYGPASAATQTPIKIKVDIKPKPAAAASPSVVPPMAFPNDKRMQQEFEADWIRLMLPSVPKTHEAISAELSDTCQTCHKLIRWNPLTPQDKIKRWLNINSICEKCANLIGDQYKKDISNNTQSRYKQHHKIGTNPSIDEIVAHGTKEGFYNATMYDGARFWSGIALQRAMPAVPK